MDVIHPVPRQASPAQADADYEDCLRAWERTSASDKPAKVARKIRAWLQAGNANARLLLWDCGLRDLPPLPVTVRVLDIGSNRNLQRVDMPWPPALERLDASACDLRALSVLPPTLKYLDLSNNGTLAELPEPLPAALEEVNFNFCGFRHLPAVWPSSLQTLRASHCELSGFPHGLPYGMRTVTVVFNKLTSLPDMPLGLKTLDASFNSITHFDGNLWALEDCNIKWQGNPVNAEQAQEILARAEAPGYRGPTITFDPPWNPPWTHESVTVPARRSHPPRQRPAMASRLQPSNRMTAFGLPQPLRIVSPGNPRYRYPMRSGFTPPQAFPSRIQSMGNAEQMVQMAQLLGLTLRFSGMDPGPSATAQLSTIAASWDSQLQAAFQPYDHHPGASDFARFLANLRNTVNADNGSFCTHVCRWLHDVAADAGLFARSCTIASGASDTCQDRVTLRLNVMLKEQLAHDIAKGKYDSNLPSLISRVRKLFRLDLLEEKAVKNAAARGNAKESIEVSLAYQVQLNQSLQLDLPTMQMKYQMASGVTPQELQAVLNEVRREEDERFEAYLVQALPCWMELMERLAPQATAEMRTARFTAYEEGMENIQRQRDGLENEERQLDTAQSPPGSNERSSVRTRRAALYQQETALNAGLGAQFMKALTRQVLQQHGATALLDPYWKTGSEKAGYQG